MIICPKDAEVKNPPVSAGDTSDAGSIPGSGRSPGEGNGNPLQYSCLGEIPWTEEPGGLQYMGLRSQTVLSTSTFLISFSLSIHSHFISLPTDFST